MQLHFSGHPKLLTIWNLPVSGSIFLHLRCMIYLNFQLQQIAAHLRNSETVSLAHKLWISWPIGDPNEKCIHGIRHKEKFSPLSAPKKPSTPKVDLLKTYHSTYHSHKILGDTESRQAMVSCWSRTLSDEKFLQLQQVSSFLQSDPTIMTVWTRPAAGRDPPQIIWMIFGGQIESALSGAINLQCFVVTARINHTSAPWKVLDAWRRYDPWQIHNLRLCKRHHCSNYTRIIDHLEIRKSKRPTYLFAAEPSMNLVVSGIWFKSTVLLIGFGLAAALRVGLQYTAIKNKIRSNNTYSQ